MKYIVLIGSNDEGEKHLNLARQKLGEIFNDIQYSCLMITEPVGMNNPAKFHNQLAVFQSELQPSVIKGILKQLEVEAGRMPEDKQSEIIKLDMDLLASDKEIYKSQDWERDFVRMGLADMNIIRKNMRFLGIIPARYASTRFPGKPLAMLGGKTVIQRVYEQVVGVVDDAYVATDDERIENVVKNFGGKVVMTSPNHRSGTDRCYEACMKVGSDFDVVVNIQGDEPFIQPSQIETVKHCFDDPKTQIATLVKPFVPDASYELLENPNSPKVVVSSDWRALYFSRSVIPYLRGKKREDWLKSHTYYKHIGLYAYKVPVLREITSLPQSSLEIAESLEQLRWLENGYTIKVGVTEVETIGIDTPEDLQLAEQFLKDHVR